MSTTFGLPLTIAGTCSLENTRGKGKSELYTVGMAAHSKRHEEDQEESATLSACTVEGDSLLTSAWSGTPTIVDTARLTRVSQC